MNKPKISVVGLGFVGLSLAVVNAKENFDTIGIDIDKEKLEKLCSGNPYFFEPKLKNYLNKSLKSKKIHFSDDLNEVLKTDITFLTVGTPSTAGGTIDLSQLRKVVAKLSKILKKKKSTHLIVVKSTVVPTTTSQVVAPVFKTLKNVRVVSNPEFLREGNSINDLQKPHLIVIGESNKKDGDILERYYKIFYKKTPEILRVDLSSAEMIKYSNNAFLATKISFINSIANLCQQLPNMDVNKIAYAIGKDSRIGSEFLKAGPGFGGSCLPKDISALIGFTKKYDKTNKLFKAVKEVNNHQALQIFQMLKELNLFSPSKTISILGLAFKANSDDIREAVSLRIVKHLLKKGLKIKVHDPMAMNNFQKIFGPKVIYCKTIPDCLKNSDCCIILTEWDDFKNLKPSIFSKNMHKSNIIDARRVLEPSNFTKLNFRAIGLGPQAVN